MKFEFFYNKEEKRFQFAFLNETQFIETLIYVSKNLGQRLGYGLGDYIDRVHAKGQVVKEIDDNFDSKKYAVVLCNDTNMVVIGDYQSNGSILTSADGIHSKSMAILFATENGTMATSDEICATAPSIIMRPYGDDLQNGKYLFPFRMYRSFNDNKFVRFVWNVGGKVNGFMRGLKMTLDQIKAAPL